MPSESREPNWQKWKAVPEVNLYEAVALSLNIDPQNSDGIRTPGWAETDFVKVGILTIACLSWSAISKVLNQLAV